MDYDRLQAARDLIAADSVSDRGNLRAVAVLEAVAAQLGLACSRQEAQALGQPQANLLVHAPGSPPRDGGLLLVTHTDTVAPGPREAWRTDPFTLHVEGDLAYGLGVADVKLDALAKLEALARAPAPGRVAFLGTFVEEVGCLGAKHFLKARPFSPRWACCGEPSELRIIDGHKGYLVARILVRDDAPPPAPARRLQLAFTGRAAHSSTPHLGESAIEKALAFCADRGLAIHAAEGGDVANKVAARCVVEVEARPGLADDARGSGATVEERTGAAGASPRRSLDMARQVAAELRRVIHAEPPAQDLRFDPPTAVLNAGVLRARGAAVELTCDARLLPGHDPDAIFTRLETWAEEHGARQGLHVGIARERSNPAMALPAGSRIREAAMEASRALALPPEPQAKPTNTEGGVFMAHGVEAIVFGPGRSTGNAHTANEQQSLSQLATAARWYQHLIASLCG